MHDFLGLDGTEQLPLRAISYHYVEVNHITIILDSFNTTVELRVRGPYTMTSDPKPHSRSSPGDS